MKYLTIPLLLCNFFIYAQVSVDVNLTTGAPNVSVPLWTVTSKDIAYPISLHYAQNGSRVGQSSDKIGYGWSPSYEGAVYRQVMGLPDDCDTENTKGWLAGDGADIVHDFVPQSDNDITDITDESNDFKVLTGLIPEYSGVIHDAEPDIFVVSAPGLYARFLFDKDGEVRTFPYQNLAIDTISNAEKALTGFRVTTTGGITYTFDRGRTMTVQVYSNPQDSLGENILYGKADYLYYTEPITFENQWYLTSITSLQGGEMVFDYAEFQNSETSKFVTLWNSTYLDTTFYYNEDGAAIWEYYTRYKESSRLRLKTISTADAMLTFRDSHYILHDFDANWPATINGYKTVVYNPLLNEIDVRARGVEGDSVLNTFYFNYQKMDLVSGGPGAAHFFLRSIQTGNDGTTGLGYSFAYEGVDWTVGNVDMPVMDADVADAFGFGANEASAPYYEQYILHKETGDRYPLQPVENEAISYLPGRNGSLDYPSLGRAMLKDITAPGGGTYHLTYEPNSYYDQQTQHSLYGGGLRVSSLTTYDGVDNYLERTYTYEAANGHSSGVLRYKPRYAFTSPHALKNTSGTISYYHRLSGSTTAFDMWKKMTVRSDRDMAAGPFSEASVFYEEVSVTDARGKTTYQFENEEKPNAVTTRFALKNYPSPEVTGNNYYALGNVNGSYTYPFAPDDQQLSAHGRVKQVTTYDAAGTLLTERIFTYEQARAPITIRALRLQPTRARAYYFVDLFDEFWDETLAAYLYDPYTIEVDGLYALREEVVTSHEEGVSKTTTRRLTTNAYGHTTEEATTLPDGSLQHQHITYAYDLDYSPSTLSGEAVNYQRMVSDKVYGMPVATYRTLQRMGEQAYVTHARVSQMDWQVQRPYVSATYALRYPLPAADYHPLSIGTDGGIMRDEALEQVMQVTGADQAQTYEVYHPKSRRYTTTLYDDEQVIGQVMNAGHDEVAFSHFENETPSFHDFETNATLYPEGRSGERSYSLNASTTLTRTLPYTGKDAYLLTLWAKNNGGTLTARITAGSSITETIAITATTGWQYYETALDLAGLGLTSSEDFTLTISSTSTLWIDDVAFYPSDATISYTNYQHSVPVATTDTYGQAVYSEYNLLGQVTKTTDQDGHILSQATYAYMDPVDIAPIISYSGNLYHNRAKTFQVTMATPALGDGYYEYHWYVSDNEALFNASPEEVNYSADVEEATRSVPFPSIDDYVIFVKVNQIGLVANYLKGTYYQKLFISKEKILPEPPDDTVPPPDISLCIAGPAGWDLCTDQSTGNGGCIAEIPEGGFTLRVFAEGQDTYSFKWYRLDSPNSSTKTALNSSFSEENDTHQVLSIPYQTQYFTVEVEDSNGALIEHYKDIAFTVIESTPNCPQP